ncbi:2,4-dienoyl-CoA reductase isoform 2 [Dorcoceras hygrometricum]|nr:2,4-dienoyl-CoA reductase isoform 2 [Dorcoceras hygrometricum]
MQSNSEATSTLEPWLRLDNKVVMVSGASSGIGRDFCLDLARSGCRIIAAARRVDRLQSLCAEINNGLGSGSSASAELSRDQPRAVAVELDIAAAGPVIQASVQKAWDAFGRIDVLINNAGVRGGIHTPLDLTEEEWNDIIKTNLTGTWLVSKFVCSLMRDAKFGGSVINISSIAGLDRGQLPGGLAYVCSKTAINSMTKLAKEALLNMSLGKDLLLWSGAWSLWFISCIQACKMLQAQLENTGVSLPLEMLCLRITGSDFLFGRQSCLIQVMALELGAYKIRVNSISPGLFKSEITQGLVEKEWLKRVEWRTIPLRTSGTTDPALTSLLRYLIHDASEYVTGNLFIVDSGVTLPGVPIFSSL